MYVSRVHCYFLRESDRLYGVVHLYLLCSYLAGDSSLDNKYWILQRTAPAVNGFEEILQPPVAVPDVAHHLNAILADSLQGSSKQTTGALNTAVEATTLGSRVGKCGKLWPSDIFIRDHITENDVLVVSVGGNDIALSPSCSTICNILGLVACRYACKVVPLGTPIVKRACQQSKRFYVAPSLFFF
eukprot:m.770112 g.770112  ORF g.770112 m.770112 type:complete len:186 (-) comp23238_c3_seq18:95-652(-)